METKIRKILHLFSNLDRECDTILAPLDVNKKAGGTDVPSVETIPYVAGQATAQDAVRSAMSLAAGGAVPPRPARTITITQTDDGATIAVVVAGLPGERCFFSSFDLRPGSHSIDVGFETLQVLNGWAFRSDRRRPIGDLRSSAA